ncbi:hypothetical protein MRB53_041582 [Persea americana]|nr:hypothetical protein MRB53_041582 [Persea americana]
MNTMCAFVIGISGCSSSGKTTLSRLLRDVWPNTFILHEDDFYWPDDQIPVKNGIQDWDCIESIDVTALTQSLAYIKSHGRLPPDLESKEDKNSVGQSNVNARVVDSWRDRACKARPLLVKPIAIIDGFLLFSEEMKSVRAQMDLKLFLRARARREARSGYVTIEGFWQDPPGYVDKIVWPNYVKDHSFLFLEGNVEGDIDAAKCKALDLHVMPRSAETDMTELFDWACACIEEAMGMPDEQT